MSRPALDIIPYAKSKLGLPYVYAACGQTVTEADIQKWAKIYTDVYTPTYINKARKFIGKQAFDCVNLIKYFVWHENVSKNYKGSEDVNADGALSRAKIKGAIATMPDRPGLCVHLKGHIGIYIGNGQVIEARGIDYGVVQTALKSRPWTSWLEFPYLDYEEDEEMFTYEDFKKYQKQYADEQAKLGVNPSIAPAEYDAAIKAGITDGSRPQSFATRQEVAVMVHRGVKK